MTLHQTFIYKVENGCRHNPHIGTHDMGDQLNRPHVFVWGGGVRYSTQVWVVVFHPGCQTHNLGLFK